jgi:DNA-binding LacI/PurR family transcriptional regulator
VLNTPGRVRESTRKAVLDAVDQLGYIPDIEARMRARRGAGHIGVLTPFFTEPAFTQRLRGIATSLSNVDYDLVIYPVETTSRLNEYLISLPITTLLDGLIIMSLRLDEQSMERFQKIHFPVVMIECDKTFFSGVTIDDFEGGRLAARYLTDKGCTRFAYLGISEDSLTEFSIDPSKQRMNGYRKALEKGGFQLPEERIVISNYSIDSARRHILPLLSEEDHPNAIFAASDLQAMGVLKACEELGLDVPGDVAVIGFDDLDFSEFIGLTTVQQPLDEAGKVAVELLLRQIKEPDRPNQQVSLPLQVVERRTA